MVMVHLLILLKMVLQTTYDETTTTIALSTDNQTIEYIDENGVQTDLNLCAAVDSCETVTSLVLSILSTNQLDLPG